MTPMLADVVEAYRQLRMRWESDWPGLERVMTGGVSWLLDRPSDTVRVPRLLMACAEVVEASGRRTALKGTEPAYHNRLHVADTLVSMASLLKARRVISGSRANALSRFETISLLAMTLHDFEHEGRCNRAPQEIEHLSLTRFEPHARLIGLSADDWTRVCGLVLKTDPGQVAKVHENFRRRGRNKHGTDDEMAVLLTEADILASVLPYPGMSLTRALATEWQHSNPELARGLLTVEGRRRFLSDVVKISSSAALTLGIQQEIDQQLLANCQPPRGQRLATPAMAGGLSDSISNQGQDSPLTS